RARYVKVRDRASFEWALVSCAASIGLVEGKVAEARIVAGGVGTRPWRLQGVEEALMGRALDEAAIRKAVSYAAEGAEPREGNAFKLPLLERTVARALATLDGAS